MANRFTDFFRRHQEPENQVVGAFTLSPDGTTLINYKPDKPADIVAVPDGVEKIGSGVFAGERAHGAKTILLPDSVVEIGDSAFAGNKVTEHVMLPANLEVIGRGAFADSTVKINDIPDSIQSIGEGAFRHNPIERVNLSNSEIQTIGRDAFVGCKELTEVALPAKIEGKDSLFDRDAFAGCSKLETINIPEGTTKIPVGAFTECGNLKEIEIPEGVLKIGANAFYNTGLNENGVMLPASMESMGSYAFGQQSGREATTVYIPEEASDSLKHRAPAHSVIVPETNTASSLVEMGLAKTDENGVLTNVDKRVGGNIIIDEKITAVEGNALDDCKKVASISVESNLTEIREGAFQSIPKVEMPHVTIDEEMMQKAERGRQSTLEDAQASANMSPGYANETDNRIRLESANIEVITSPNKEGGSVQVVSNDEFTVVAHVTPEKAVDKETIAAPTNQIPTNEPEMRTIETPEQVRNVMIDKLHELTDSLDSKLTNPAAREALKDAAEQIEARMNGAGTYVSGQASKESENGRERLDEIVDRLRGDDKAKETEAPQAKEDVALAF